VGNPPTQDEHPYIAFAGSPLSVDANIRKNKKRLKFIWNLR